MSEKIEILNKTPWFINFYNFILFNFSSAMERPEDENLALVPQDLEQRKANKSGNK